MATTAPGQSDTLGADTPGPEQLHPEQAAPCPPLGPDLAFELPPALEAAEPAEARGLARDEVRLLVSTVANNHVRHARFRELPRFLRPGDLLVLNTSATINAALPAWRADGEPIRLHLSNRLARGVWLVEMRRLEPAAAIQRITPQPGQAPAPPAPVTTGPLWDGQPGERLRLPAGGTARLWRPGVDRSAAPERTRLWLARLDLPLTWLTYLARYGQPIRYGYVKQNWPLAVYQTVYHREPGSAEMPSAGRAFTPALMTRLWAGGVQLAPLVLHTGVSSLEADEPPYPEPYRVPAGTARLVNATRNAGRRVIAVGTTVVRALETVAGETGQVRPGAGWTDLVVTPERGLRAVDGLITGLHEPRASHLQMLEALAGRDHLRLAYAEALCEAYLWHEFGDLHLILGAE